MAKKGEITKAEASKEIKLFLNTLMECLREEDAVKFQEFGKFELKTVKKRMGRNPKTGETCFIPEHKKVKFYASEILIDRIERKERQFI